MSGTPQEQGREFEKQFAKRIGGKVVPGSGSTWHSKLDVKGKSFLWSLKYTTKDSFRLTRGHIDEIQKAIVGPGGEGGSAIGGLAVSINGEDLVVLRATDFLQLLQEDVKLVEASKADKRRVNSKVPKFKRDKEI